MRAFGLLENLNALIPDPVASPLQQIDMQGQERKRASAPRGRNRPGKPWTWGDDE